MCRNFTYKLQTIRQLRHLPMELDIRERPSRVDRIGLMRFLFCPCTLLLKNAKADRNNPSLSAVWHHGSSYPRIDHHLLSSVPR